jgi:hypothetical protein
MVQQRQVSKIVHINFRSKSNHHTVSSQLHGLHVVAKGELADATVLVVVPDHNLMWRKTRHGAATHERKNVAAEKHLNDSNAARRKVTLERLLEGLDVIDTKALVSPSCEAARVLVKGHVEQLQEGQRDGRHAST